LVFGYTSIGPAQLLTDRPTIFYSASHVKQVARVVDRTAFFLGGELIELDKTDKMFTAPHDKRMDDHIIGKFG